MSQRTRIGVAFCFFLLTVLMSISSFPTASAQTTAQGSVQGTVTDPSGAVVAGAKITITNKATGQVVNTATNGSGTYSSGALLPGQYVVRVEAKSFKTAELPVTVQVTVTSAGNIRLAVGQPNEVGEVRTSAAQVNTEQATVQGVLTAEQIDKLPVNGRNFLDLAQLESGVQMQDGTSFDPTKAGYASVSINGVFGRTPRIEVDGLDVSDETVGTTTQNLPMSSIQEFNISRSSLDLSTEVTSSGAVNVTTRSGTNGLHGQVFYNFRDQAVGFAAFPGGQSLPFQRNQFGGRLGGPLIKDKLFFFVDSERSKQDSLAPVVIAPPFQALSGGFSSPFRSTSSVGKLDWQATQRVHLFYKFAYDVNFSSSNAFATDYSIYGNRDNTPSHTIGVDFLQGNWSHSFRFGYLKFHNLIVGGTSSTPTAQNPFPGIEMFFFDNGLTTGPNFLAPQQTYQGNKQIKYDGSRVWGSHILRFGAGVNRIQGGGFASFYGLGPFTVTGVNSGVGYSCGDPTGASCDTNPGAYPVLEAFFGNGQGYFTEKAAFGAPSGGQADTRFEVYAGDSWKIKPNLTLTYGLRYLRDTGRTDSDLAPIPCSAIDTSVVVGPLPCSGSAQLLDQFGFFKGLGNRVRQPNPNFGPQVGFAWDPGKSGKTVFRGGAGIYYENSVFNNVLFDRPAKLNSGLFWNFAVLACSGGGAGSDGLVFPGNHFVSSIDGADLATQVCFQPLNAPAGTAPSAAQALADLQTAYQAAVAAAGPAANSNFVGRTLELDSNQQGYAVYDPNYRTPRSYQMNLGLQREIVKGGVFSADYVRNVSLHFPLTIDVNHVGDARYLNVAAAQNAIAATIASFSACSGTPTVACVIANGGTIDDFAANGLDSGVAFFGGSAAPAFGLDPSTGAAFAGINPLMGVGDVQFPAGRSVYNALQTSFKQQVRDPFRGVNGLDLQIVYTWSRFQGNGGNDQNFSALAWDQRNPTKFYGPTSLDRTHQFKFGATFDVAHHGPRLSVFGGFSSAPPSSLSLQITNGGSQSQTGDIFRNDLTGDGTIGDLMNAASGIGKPGTFMRGVSASGLVSTINNFNTNVAGTLTPAGHALVNAGLISQADMIGLGAVVETIPAPLANNAANKGFKDVGLNLAWPFKIHERFTIEPSFSFFNLFNYANFNYLGSTGSLPQAGYLTGGPGSANGTVTGKDPTHNVLRTGVGTGTFASGAPREAEFGLRVAF
jgi:hypothetical protein